MPWRPLPLLLAASAHSAVPPELTDLDLNNFDTFMAEHDNVLVHFWAPWSKKCEAFKPQLEKVAAVSEFADSMKHARSDISDKRGYTSYLEKFGVLKLPTLVLFRNGHPEMYSYDAPLDYDGVVKWLQAQTSTPALPRGADDISETHFFEQQLQAHQQALRRREQQREQQVATVSDEEKQRRREFLHPGKRATPEADDEPPARDGLPLPDTHPAVVPASAAATHVEAGRQLEGAATQLQPAAVVTERAKDGAMAEDSGTACVAFEQSVQPVGDADFESVVLDKAHDTFVLFYRPNPRFCSTNGTVYAAYAVPQPSVKRLRMDVAKHKSPFVFEDAELPVLMLFPAKDKRPLEYNDVFDADKLRAFATEHCSTLPKSDDDGAKADAMSDKAEL